MDVDVEEKEEWQRATRFYASCAWPVLTLSGRDENDALVLGPAQYGAK